MSIFTVSKLHKIIEIKGTIENIYLCGFPNQALRHIDSAYVYIFFFSQKVLKQYVTKKKVEILEHP